MVVGRRSFPIGKVDFSGASCSTSRGYTSMVSFMICVARWTPMLSCISEWCEKQGGDVASCGEMGAWKWFLHDNVVDDGEDKLTAIIDGTGNDDNDSDNSDDEDAPRTFELSCCHAGPPKSSTKCSRAFGQISFSQSAIASIPKCSMLGPSW